MENTIWWIGGVFVLMVLFHGIQTGGYNQGHEDARESSASQANMTASDENLGNLARCVFTSWRHYV